MTELLELHMKIKDFVESDISWPAKYDFVFSKNISQRVFELARGFNYYDPDTSYEEDVMAFFNAFTEYLFEDRK